MSADRDTASAALLTVIEEMRHNVRCPDDGDAGSVWSWRIDEWADQLAAVLASLPAPVTDTASAALLKAVAAIRRNLRDQPKYWIRVTDTPQPRSVQGVLLVDVERAIDAALASLPAPAAPEKPNPKDCGATDYPVWGDGSHDTVTCARPAGHEGPHTGLIGAHQWTW